MNKKRKSFFLILFLLTVQTFPLFATNVTSNAYENAPNIQSTWLNAPLVKMLTQFCNMEERWIVIARDIAFVLVILNIIWQCIQIAFGTMEIRKALVSNITKWFLFLFIMCMYPAINVGLLKFSQEVAQKMTGGWVSDIGNNLAKYYEDLYQICKKKGTEQSVIIALKEKQVQDLILYKTKWMAANRIQLTNSDIGLIEFSDTELENMYQIQLNQAKAELESAKHYQASDVSVQTYHILRSIFSADMDSTEHVTSWNIMLNTVFPKTYMAPELITRSNGKAALGKSVQKKANIHVISPDAIMKTIYLCASIMWEREWTVVNQEWMENSYNKQNDPDVSGASKWISRKFTIVDFPFSRIGEIIFCIILIVLMVLNGSVALIQYMMCLLEYTLVAGACAILIPFMLFDGLNDMAQKVISILFQQALKLIFCIIICTFCLWCYFYLAEQCVGAVTGMSMQNFVFGAFISLLGGAFMTNAPKLASVLATGTPQMSTGEFFQQAGSYLAAGRLAQRAGHGGVHFVSKAGKMTKEGTRKTGQAGIAIAGQSSRNRGARKGAYQAARDSGMSRGQAFGAAFGAGINQQMKDTGRTIQRGASNFFTGSGGAGGKGRGGGGTAANSSLYLNSDKWTNSSGNPEVDKEKIQTAEAHNYNYGQSMHYENVDDRYVATRPQKLGEHMKTQHKDAKEAAYEKYKSYFDAQKKNKENT